MKEKLLTVKTTKSLITIILISLVMVLCIGIGTQTMAASTSKVTINEKNFPDKTFRNYVQKFDKNKDKSLSGDELKAVTEIDVSEKKIKTLKGIGYFTKLEELYCTSNQLTSLDISKNTALKYLNCIDNQLTKLDVSKNTKLGELYCNMNKLTSLNVSKNKKLSGLYCGKNKLTSLDLSKNTNLVILSCFDNKITSLNLSKNKELVELYCQNNRLTSLDLSKNTNLSAAYNVSATEQKTTLGASRVNGKWQVNLGNVVGKANRNKVTLSGKSYTYKNGIVNLGSKLPKSFKYNYNLGNNRGKMDVTVTPKEIKKVTFNANGGTKLSAKSKSVMSGNTIGKLPTAGKKNYEFKGWYTKKSGGSKIATGTKITKNQTVYAHWTKVTVKKAGKPTVKTTGKGKLSVKIGKVTGAKGYQIVYSTSSKFKSAKSASVTSVSKTISKLKSKNTYYVKVRAYKKDSLGNKVYGSYSKVAKIKVK